jgi:hypothetical protein
MTTTREVLVAARALIAEPSRWLQGCYARDEAGAEVALHSPHATCFCAEGAVLRVSPPGLGAEFVAALQETGMRTRWSAHRFNDANSHASILAAFDRAIEAA